MNISPVSIKRILIIDDDPDIRNWFRVLQKNAHGYSFHFLLDDLPDVPDMIFLEENHLDLERLSEIIRLAREQNIPIVHMSTRGLTEEGQTFMRKPLERKAVDAKIRTLLKI